MFVNNFVLMDAIRQFVEVENGSFNVVLPKDFKAKRAEVIIFPSESDGYISEQTRRMLDIRLNEYLKNPEDVSDFDEFMEELENEI